eukprot:TRINITY_DN589_c0_g1_i19.p1 TRINITY_DN589_c0_g1~~TRINITY_DN589_c0_g1_i19.p1  ORF type:complete len:288 (-),score=99.54 TRINITY_DN589_c0_g1_i19:311-1174(-)
MRVLIAFSSFLLGASLADNFINKLIPDVDFDNEDCIGDACFLRNQLLSVDKSKTDPSTGLAYNERSLAYANTQSLLAICLPKIAKEAVADSFASCEDKKMEDICVFAKRGWLVKDAQEESVANLDFLKTAFNGLPGGDEAVKECLKVKEEAEVYDYDYEYDYYDYFDEYDYLEEGEGVERRTRREAGNGRNKKRTEAKIKMVKGGGRIKIKTKRRRMVRKRVEAQERIKGTRRERIKITMRKEIKANQRKRETIMEMLGNQRMELRRIVAKTKERMAEMAIILTENL